jgi:hypothetical protein
LLEEFATDRGMPAHELRGLVCEAWPDGLPGLASLADGRDW